jgi:uncharacterized protein (TIGR00369 family)
LTSEAATADAPGSVDRDAARRVAGVFIDGGPFPIRPHNCFACGASNARGLGLTLHVEGDACWSEVTLPERFEGWEGIAHGGIVATILDEVMAWSLVHNDAWGMTARMSVRFKRPVPVGVPIRAEGRLVEQRRRLLVTEARMVEATRGDLLATADGLYMAAPARQKADLKRRYGFDVADKAARGR